MKSTNYVMVRYDADDGYVFDWKEPRFTEVEDENGNITKVQEHLYAKTMYLGITDSIDNYVEVEVVKD